MQVRFRNIEPAIDVQVEFNGRVWLKFILRMIDFHFRIVKVGAINPYGCVYEYLLTPKIYASPRVKGERIEKTCTAT